ncbi:MAG: hypothetical protein AAF442_00050 [Pseudomonadota bacterium]
MSEDQTLIDLAQANEDQPTQDAPEQAKASPEVKPEPTVIDVDGERITVPEDLIDPQTGEIKAEAAAKRVLDLRRQISEKNPPPPETYQLNVPEELQDTIKVDPDDPLAGLAMAWAKEQGITQEGFDKLVAGFYGLQAKQGEDVAGYQAEQERILKKAWGDKTEAIKGELARWITGIIGEDIKKPEVINELSTMAATASGVQLLKKIKDTIGEQALPATRDASGAGAISTADLQALQASEAYNDEAHPDHAATVAKVRAGYQQLYPDR